MPHQPNTKCEDVTPAYQIDLCQRVLGTEVVAPFALKEGVRVLVVPFAHTVAMLNCAYSVVGPRIWNRLPRSYLCSLDHVLMCFLAMEKLPFRLDWGWEHY